MGTLVKRSLVTVMVLLALIIAAGCGRSPAGALKAAPTPVPEAIPTATPPTPTAAVSAPAPDPATSQTVNVAEPAAGQPKAHSGMAKGIRWRVRQIGYPLSSDDPTAKGKKVVLLSFDDGPHPVYTDMILKVLKENGIKAIFFVTGYGAKNEDVLKRIAADGHIIGTHTVNHDNLRKMNKEQQRAEIVPVNETVERVTGKQPVFFRPPFGAYNDDTLALMSELNMQLLNWSHGSGDWLGVKDGHKDPKEVVADVLATEPRQPGRTGLHAGAVILMHDTLRHTAEALPEIIRGLTEKGYEFAMLDEK